MKDEKMTYEHDWDLNNIDKCVLTTPKGLRKIRDVKPPCLHPEHKPPQHIFLEPGVYEYTCPQCGEKIEFAVPLTVN